MRTDGSLSQYDSTHTVLRTGYRVTLGREAVHVECAKSADVLSEVGDQ
jgi:hypothetical protein